MSHVIYASPSARAVCLWEVPQSVSSVAEAIWRCRPHAPDDAYLCCVTVNAYMSVGKPQTWSAFPGHLAVSHHLGRKDDIGYDPRWGHSSQIMVDGEFVGPRYANVGGRWDMTKEALRRYVLREMSLHNGYLFGAMRRPGDLDINRFAAPDWTVGNIDIATA